MDKTKSIIIDASSLVHLKAELYRKQELVKQIKKSTSNEEPQKRKPLKCKGEEVVKKTKHGPKVENLAAPNNEEEELMKKSRLALEAKAKLYEQIVVNKVTLGEEEQESYLVDFHRKSVEDPKYARVQLEKSSVESEENSAPLNIYKPIDEKQLHSNREHVKPPTAEAFTNPVSEKDSEEPLHYQDIQFNEIRDHGVGYYAFSTDKEKRKEQMDLLQTLRQQTEKSRISYEETQQKKKAAVKSRLAKICERRKIPKSVIEEYVKKDEEKQNMELKFDTVSDVPLNDIPLPDDTLLPTPEQKTEKIRPWDIGKNLDERIHHFVKEKKKASQCDWIENRRTERNEEFAPPSFYQ